MRTSQFLPRMHLSVYKFSSALADDAVSCQNLGSTTIANKIKINNIKKNYSQIIIKNPKKKTISILSI
jgi:hypothetical protein